MISKASRRSAKGLLPVLLFVAVFGSNARAGTATIPVGNTPVLNIQMTTGNVTIRTWNRAQIGITTDGSITWQHYGAQRVAEQIPSQFATLAQTVQTPQGEITLAPEVWVLPALSGDHDGVVLHGNGDTTVTVPAGTALVATRLGVGRVVLQNYHDGIFFADVHTGAVQLHNVSGTGFAQVVRGPLIVNDSNFTRFRGRTAVGNVLFTGVAARQITVTSIRGSIVYDNGSFQPGLARFESEYGNVALGVGNGGAHIGAHSDTGRILTHFNGIANVTRSSTNGDTQAQIGAGDATVTASSTHGGIVLYDGSLQNHPQLLSRFPALQRFYQQRLERQHAPRFQHSLLKHTPRK